jgi:hypothetical protein
MTIPTDWSEKQATMRSRWTDDFGLPILSGLPVAENAAGWKGRPDPKVFPGVAFSAVPQE